MRLVFLSFFFGIAASAMISAWPTSWWYVPAVVFAAFLVGYFAPDIAAMHPNKAVAAFGSIAFIGFMICAYYVALFEAQWVLGTNGFANFADYHASAAEAALFMACFVGGCIGALMLAAAIRYLFFRFDLVRGMVLFALAAGALSSMIAVGFEAFSFTPEYLCPIWFTGMTAMVVYLREYVASPSSQPL